jgi:DNA-binding transcriptional MerR regulator
VKRKPSASEELSISQMAAEFAVTMRTLRFYESKGLMQPRRIGNRRFYDEACRARLRLVLKGKAMGLGLDEIGELVDVVESKLSDASGLRKCAPCASDSAISWSRGAIQSTSRSKKPTA